MLERRTRGGSVQLYRQPELGPESPLQPEKPSRKGQKQKPHRTTRDLEHREQVQLFAWAEQAVATIPQLALLYAIPNWFGTQTVIQGARAKAEGRKPGVPDICLPIPRGGFAALYIEMKRPGGSTTPAQADWQYALRINGNKVELHTTHEGARAAILEYIALR
jgi:hypothetical protein